MTDFSAEEIAQVIYRYPRLHSAGCGVLEGFLDLHAIFDGEERRDEFQVRIVAPPDYPNSMPTLFETGTRTAEIATKYGIADLSDLHRNPGIGTACLCVKQEEQRRFPEGSNLFHFIEALVVPYLFGLSHFDEHGKWPWPDHSHGVLGIVEHYADTTGDPSVESINSTLKLLRRDPSWHELRRQLRKPSAMRMCVCGSKRSASCCHKDVWAGIAKLNSDMQKLGLDVHQTLLNVKL